MKCSSIEAAKERYGQLDIPACHWPEGEKWLKMFQVPEGFAHWKLLASDYTVKHFVVNIDMEEALTQSLEAIKTKGLVSQLKTFDGCFNIRLVRGSTSAISAHSYALAIDINAAENKLGQEKGGLYDCPELVKCFTDAGFNWGGHFKERKDPQHFSYCWEG